MDVAGMSQIKKWVKMVSSKSVYDYVDRKPDEPINVAEAVLQDIKKQRLKMNLPPISLYDKTPLDSIKLTSESADSILKEFFSKGEGRGINIYNPSKGFFENSETKYNPLIKKWEIENKNPFNDANTIFSSSNEKKSYIKSLTYDPTTGKTEVEAETHYFKYKGYKKLEEQMLKYGQEYMGAFPEPNPNSPYTRNKYNCTKPLFEEYEPQRTEPKYGPSPLHDYMFQPQFEHYPFRWGFDDGCPKTESKDVKRRKLKRNLNIIIKSRAEPMYDIPENEWVALGISEK